MSAPGFDIARGDTTKLKGSAQPTTRYRIVRPLCNGRLSELFVAEDVELHREVVLKRLQAKHQRAPGYRIRFNRTAEVTSGLEHPCIPPIYNHGLDSDGRPYYTTRYLVGENLSEAVTRLQAADPSDPPRSLDAKSLNEGFRRLLHRLLSVCDAISYAHGRGVVHCSLNPQRVILGRYNETLVVGWGRAELIYGRRRPSSAGAKPNPVGTPAKDAVKPGRPPREASQSRIETPTAYTSPEQLRGDPAAAGILSDVYSLGALLFYIATGKPPFSAPADELPAAIEKGLQPSEWAAVEEISASLARICAKAMSVDPMNRHATIHEFARELEGWLETHAATLAPGPAVTSTVAVKQAPGLSAKRWALPFVGACVVCGAIGAWIGRGTVPTVAAVVPSAEANPEPKPTAAETPPAWMTFAGATAAATPDVISSLTASWEKFSLPRNQADLLPSLIDAAEAALKSGDDAKALKHLTSAEPLLGGRNDAATTALRQRWAAAIATIADRTSDPKAAVAILERTLTAVETQRRQASESWLEPTQPLAQRLGRLHAAQGRFADALRATRNAASTNVAFSIERAEWLGFTDRHAEAAAEFKRIVERLSAIGGKSAGHVELSQQRMRALVGLVEQLIALEKSPVQALDEAKTAGAGLNTADAETEILLARLNGALGAWQAKTGKSKEAAASLKSSTASWANLLAKQGASASELRWASSAWDALRRLDASNQRLPEALAAADRAVELLSRIPAKETVTDSLDAIDGDRGVLLVQLDKLPEAEAAFTRIVERGGSGAVNARYLRSACRLEQKNLAAARADADELAKGKEATARYLAARVFARLSGATDGQTNAAAQTDGARAIELLKELAKDRFFAGDRATLPADDPELDALRQREDFKASFAAPPAATATANPSPPSP